MHYAVAVATTQSPKQLEHADVYVLQMYVNVSKLIEICRHFACYLCSTPECEISLLDGGKTNTTTWRKGRDEGDREMERRKRDEEGGKGERRNRRSGREENRNERRGRKWEGLQGEYVGRKRRNEEKRRGEENTEREKGQHMVKCAANCCMHPMTILLFHFVMCLLTLQHPVPDRTAWNLHKEHTHTQRHTACSIPFYIDRCSVHRC